MVMTMLQAKADGQATALDSGHLAAGIIEARVTPKQIEAYD